MTEKDRDLEIAHERKKAPGILSGASKWMYPIVVILCFYMGASTYSRLDFISPKHGHKKPDAACLQVKPLHPVHGSSKLQDMDKYISSKAFLNASIERMTGAVQIPTESFDDMGSIGEDKRWEIMYDFADYLKATFPVVHANMALEKINTHGLLYTWRGTDDKLKPTLLMAHQDVVPVPKTTVDAWTHPPFSGYFDGERIWGRGASDCKNQLVGILEAAEELIKAGFTPKRTVIMPFGFDEEVSGPQGAGHLAPFLLERYGKDGIAVVVDEGAGFINSWGMRAAIPGVGEKGYTDVHITVRMPGGHSSIPPDHTGIGVMSELITLIEADQYNTFLAAENPYLGLLTCGAEHAPKFPSKIEKLLHKHKTPKTCKAKGDKLAIEVAKEGLGTRYLMQTSIAADVISGGVKNNALPERTVATINHRVNIGERTQDVHDKITHHTKKLAKKYNLTLNAFNGKGESPNSITLETAMSLEPAPVTPSDPTAASPWTILSGTTRALYGDDLIVAPGLMTGNTDTKYYWNLTKHIFRFTPGWDEKQFGLGNIHTVDENIPVASHINMVRWMSLFIRNMDESGLA